MATTVKQTIGEHDVVAFTEPIAKAESTGTWPAGTEGTVVSDFGEAKMVEISDDEHYGATLDMPIVPVEKLKLITKYSKGIEARPSDPAPIRARSQKRRKARREAASSSSTS